MKRQICLIALVSIHLLIVAVPLGFTDFDAEGMLVEGFDQLSTMATIYNYPYYPQHMEKSVKPKGP